MHFIASFVVLCLGVIVVVGVDGAILHQKRADVSVVCHTPHLQTLTPSDLSEHNNPCNNENLGPHCECGKMKRCGTEGLLCYPKQQCAACKTSGSVQTTYHCADSSVSDMDYCANREGGLGFCSCNGAGLATEGAELFPDPNNPDALLPTPETQEQQQPSQEQTFAEETGQLQVPQPPKEISYIGDGYSETGSEPTEPDTTTDWVF